MSFSEEAFRMDPAYYKGRLVIVWTNKPGLQVRGICLQDKDVDHLNRKIFDGNTYKIFYQERNF